MKQTLKHTSFFFNFLLAEKALYFLYNVETNLQVDLRKSSSSRVGILRLKRMKDGIVFSEVRILIS